MAEEKGEGLPAGVKLVRTLRGHTGRIGRIAWSPDGRMLGSPSGDRTIGLWDAETGKPLRTLGSDSGRVSCVAFADRGGLLAAKSNDFSIRLWSTDTGACVAAIPQAASAIWPPDLAFHPRLPLLAAVGSDPGQTDERVIHIWELDFEILLARAGAPTVTYTSAKIVLAGKRNVGKSYLAHRIAAGEPPVDGTIQTTHGMEFWPMAPERLSPAAKTHCGGC
jgi:WD40 repeat protein